MSNYKAEFRYLDSFSNVAFDEIKLLVEQSPRARHIKNKGSLVQHVFHITSDKSNDEHFSICLYDEACPRCGNKKLKLDESVVTQSFIKPLSNHVWNSHSFSTKVELVDKAIESFMLKHAR